MKAVLLCLAIAPLVVSCKFSYTNERYISTSSVSTSTTGGSNGTVNEEYRKTIKKKNWAEECSYSYKRNDYGYSLKSNGPLKIVNGSLQTLRSGQTVDLKITEDGQEYSYLICKGASGAQVTKFEGTLTPEDEGRVKKALLGVEKQAK